MEELSQQARNKMAAVYGVIIGIYYIITTTIANIEIINLNIFYTVKGVGYMLFLLLLGIFTVRIRKANGGYLDFKKTYGSIIIMVLISGVFYYVYNYIYIESIDKQFIYKYKASSLAFMQQKKAPAESISKTTAEMDRQIKMSGIFNLGNNVMSFATMALQDCLAGLLVALIVKKNPPALK